MKKGSTYIQIQNEKAKNVGYDFNGLLEDEQKLYGMLSDCSVIGYRLRRSFFEVELSENGMEYNLRVFDEFHETMFSNIGFKCLSEHFEKFSTVHKYRKIKVSVIKRITRNALSILGIGVVFVVLFLHFAFGYFSGNRTISILSIGIVLLVVNIVIDAILNRKVFVVYNIYYELGKRPILYLINILFYLFIIGGLLMVGMHLL